MSTIGLAGDSRIHSIDLISPKLNQVNPEDRIWGYSIDMDKDIYASSIHSVRRIPSIPRMIKLNFHSGGSIVVTPGTSIGLSNGKWMAAKDIAPGTRVMSSGIYEDSLTAPDGTLLRPIPTESHESDALDWEPLGWYFGEDPRNRKAVLASEVVKYCIDNYKTLSEDNYNSSLNKVQGMNRSVWGYPSFKSYMAQYDDEVAGIMANWVTSKEWVSGKQEIYTLRVAGRGNVFFDIGDLDSEESHMIVIKVR